MAITQQFNQGQQSRKKNFGDAINQGTRALRDDYDAIRV